MKKQLFFALLISIIVHGIVLLNFENLDFSSQNTFSKKIGLSGTKISIKVLKTTKKKKSTKLRSKIFAKSNDAQKESSTGSQIKTSSGNQKALSKYLSDLRAKIFHSRFKTRAAIRLKQKGVVTVGFKVKSPNIITDIKILRPSKYEQLNYSAMRTIESMKDVPSIPKELKVIELSTHIPLDF